MAKDEQAKIFKKIEVVEGGGHHGGGWKVAYADFMTAMMAFFLLMWILASSDEQKLRGIAEYFTDATLPGGSGVLDGATLGPPGTLSASNGAVVLRGSELGRIDDPAPAQWEVRDATATPDPEQKVAGTNEGENENPAAGNPSDVVDVTDGEDSQSEYANTELAQGEGIGGANSNSEGDGAGGVSKEHAEEVANFARLEMKIAQAIEENPDLRPLKPNVVFEKTPEGLKIQIIDQKGKPMFSSGNANLLNASHKLMTELGSALAELPNDMVVSGHTDSVPFADSSRYDNWDLSSDRANAIRRTFEASGVGKGRILRVSGLADTQPLKPEDPEHPSNRRITVFVQHSVPKPKAPPIAKPLMKKADDMDKMAPKAGDKMDKPMKSKKAMAPKKDDAKKMAKAEPTKEMADEKLAASIDDAVFEKLRNALR